MMGLPQPRHVEEMAARTWSSTSAQHALLFLSGIAQSLASSASGADERNRSRLEARRREVELDVATLAEVMREHPVDVPGAALGGRLCTLLACVSDGQLAEVLGVPLAVILAGRMRMGAIAQRMVEGGGGPVSGPSPTVSGG